MVIVVPMNQPLDSLLTSLTPEVWDDWMESLYPTEYHLRLPRFDLEYDAKLKSALKRMGMGIAFEAGGRADFSDMVDVPVDPGDVFLDRVNHATFLRLDEEGTEAAAATSVTVGLWSLDQPPLAVWADRPFLVAIRERHSGTILFLGATYDPR